MFFSVGRHCQPVMFLSWKNQGRHENAFLKSIDETIRDDNRNVFYSATQDVNDVSERGNPPVMFSSWNIWGTRKDVLHDHDCRCAACGGTIEDNNYDLHHPDPSTKGFNVSVWDTKKVKDAYGDDTEKIVREEARKTVPMHTDCHQDYHRNNSFNDLGEFESREKKDAPDNNFNFWGFNKNRQRK